MVVESIPKAAGFICGILAFAAFVCPYGALLAPAASEALYRFRQTEEACPVDGALVYGPANAKSRLPPEE